MHDLDTGRFDTSKICGTRALVIGGTTDIGLAVVHMLASLGAEVVTTSPDQRALDALLSDSERFGFEHVTGLVADISSREGRNLVFGTVDHRWNGLDVLVNCAMHPRSSNHRPTGDRANGKTPPLAPLWACVEESAARMSNQGRFVDIGAPEPAPQDNNGGASGSALPAALRDTLDARGIAMTRIEAVPVARPQRNGSGSRRRNAPPTFEPFDVANAVLFCLIQPGSNRITMHIQAAPVATG